MSHDYVPGVNPGVGLVSCDETYRADILPVFPSPTEMKKPRISHTREVRLKSTQDTDDWIGAWQ